MIRIVNTKIKEIKENNNPSFRSCHPCSEHPIIKDIDLLSLA